MLVSMSTIQNWFSGATGATGLVKFKFLRLVQPSARVLDIVHNALEKIAPLNQDSRKNSSNGGSPDHLLKHGK